MKKKIEEKLGEKLTDKVKARQSAKALKKATDAVNKLTEENLKDLYSKYKKQIEIATKGLNKNSETYKIKKLFITLVCQLKDIVNSSKKNITKDDRKN